MGIELSVVSGTYNRLKHLKNMVNSVRASVGFGVSYEIVLVDGGSTDGTIEWCKSQPDIVLIEQGELLGAVKAFYAGCYAARGRYVVIGNDDITFTDDTLTLMRAVAFMEDHPEIGVGCFYQDRGGKDWHLEYMPAVLNGRQITHIYGQVCIVPKWLGDRVGWWGDYLHTYGGDNELSSQVLELGFKVEPAPCCCIHDLAVNDGLRERNLRVLRDNDNAARAGHKPAGGYSGTSWGRKWTRHSLCGPHVRMTLAVPCELSRKTRFMYLPIYEVGHPHQKRTKRGLRDALSKRGMVQEFDYIGVSNSLGDSYMLAYLRDIADAWNPDVILMQVHTPSAYSINAKFISLLKSEHPNAKLVNWNGDYHPEDLLSPANVAMAKEFDLQCVVTTQVADVYRQAGVNWKYWQVGYEESDAQPDGNTPRHDVVFLANAYARERVALGRVLRLFGDSAGCSVGLYGTWPAAIGSNGNTLYDFDAGCKLYRAAKIAISDSQWKGATGFVSNRLFQAMAAGGALLLQQRFSGMEELLGLRDGVHLVVWDDVNDLRSKMKYWLDDSNDSKRRRITATGCEFMREHHSFDARVDELMGWLGGW